MGLGKQTVLTKIITKLLRTNIVDTLYTIHATSIYFSICHVDTVPCCTMYTHCFPCSVLSSCHHGIIVLGLQCSERMRVRSDSESALVM